MQQEWKLEGNVATALLGMLVFIAGFVFVSLQMNEVAAVYVCVFTICVILKGLIPLLGIGIRFDAWSLWHLGGCALLMLLFHLILSRMSGLVGDSLNHTALQATLWAGFMWEVWDRLKPTNPPPDATWFMRNVFYSEGKFDIADLFADSIGAFAVFFFLK